MSIWQYISERGFFVKNLNGSVFQTILHLPTIYQYFLNNDYSGYAFVIIELLQPFQRLYRCCIVIIFHFIITFKTNCNSISLMLIIVYSKIDKETYNVRQ